MTGAARLGDTCTGHDCWPPRENDEASNNVFVNSLGSHRKGDHWVTHTCGTPHDSTLKEGSPSVFVNGKEMGRIGDPIECGGTVAVGSQNVFIGG